MSSDTPEAKHTDTLVARLRHSALKCLENIHYYNPARKMDARQAAAELDEDADYVEQLEAENANLRAKLEKAEAALEWIANDDWDRSYQARRVARAALTEQAKIRSPVQSDGGNHD